MAQRQMVKEVWRMGGPTGRKMCLLPTALLWTLLWVGNGLALQHSGDSSGGLTFQDITDLAGVAGPDQPGRTGGHGVMFADVDGDGLPDLYITMIFEQPMADLFFSNLGGGRFREEAAKRGIDDYDGGSHGACFADLSNNGHFDLFNGSTWDQPDLPAINRLYENDGQGFFTDVTATSGLPTDRRWGTRAVLALDFDGNGWLDLFCVTGYLGSDRPAEDRNEVYRNLGGLKFQIIEDGVLTTAACGQGATDTDYDGDGRVDIIAANRTGPIHILKNMGNGQFQSIDPRSIGVHHRAADGITMGDVTNNGHLDMLLTSAGEGHLYWNNGDGTFEHRQSFADTRGYMGALGDLNHNGWLDLVFAGDDNVYLNDGKGQFVVGPSVPMAQVNDPRGIALADIDGDGDLDFAIACKRSTNRLIRNDLSGGGRWLKVALISPQGQAGAFGARVFAYPSGTFGQPDSNPRLLAMREARSNNGYLGQDDPVLHFGLGEHAFVDLEVRFTDGSRLVRTQVPTDQTQLLDGRTAPDRP